MDQQTVLQRRAIYTVLQEWLPEDRLIEALKVFEDHHNGKPAIAIHDYLSRIDHLFDQQLETREIRRRLMEVLVRKSHDLAPDPLPLLHRAWAHEASELLHIDPEPAQLALHEFVCNLLHKVTSHQRAQLHTRLAKQLKKRFFNGSYDQLSQYLITENPQFLAYFTDDSLRDFFTIVYVACCEIMGPVAADQWVGNALLEVRRSNPEAADHLNRFL